MNYKKTILFLCVIFFVLGGKKLTAQTTDTFNYVADTVQTWVVPGCVTQVTVQLWGGGGSGEYYCYGYGYGAGGSGAYYSGVISGLNGGDVLTLYVPSCGKYTNYCGVGHFGGSGGWPGGGQGGDDNIYEEYGGGGGGYAAIAIGGTYYVVAGAGGGGGSYSFYYANGGGGGATTGGTGGDVYCPSCGGTGGSLLTGGCYQYNIIACDAPTCGSAFQGGYGGGHGSCFSYYFAGGGGGGGYYGGGGGGDYFGGGGGGSSFPASTFSSGGITFTNTSNLQGTQGVSASNQVAPGSPPADIAYGGFLSSGGNGLIIITYTGNAIPLNTVISAETSPICGICNGNATVTASGGGGTYTYSWAPTGQTNATATGLCAGTYTVTVDDSCGDVSTASVLLVSTSITVTANVTANVTCNGNCTGMAAATVSLATPPYTYSWAPMGGSNAIATGLCAGTCTVTVRDVNGCTASASVNITQPSANTASTTVTCRETGYLLCY